MIVHFVDLSGSRPIDFTAGTEGLRRDAVGYEAGKKTKWIKRHVLVDALGLMLRGVVHPASVQDRDATPLVLDKRTRRRFPFLQSIFADRGYQGPKAQSALVRIGDWRLQVVRPEPEQKGFAVLPKRWIVERTLS